MFFRHWILLIAIASFALLPARAWAFKVWALSDPLLEGNQCETDGIDVVDCGDDATFMRWFVAEVPFALNEDAEDAATVGSPALTLADLEGVLQASYQSWQDVASAYIRFTYLGTTPNRMSSVDGSNTTVWFDPDLDDDDWDGLFGTPELPGSYYGATCVTVTVAGEIVDADIIMNSFQTWAWSEDCAVKDVQGTLTHECGHSIGLAHPEGCGVASGLRATMCQGNPCDGATAWKRSLTADDEASAACLYPELPTLVLIDQTGSMCAGTRMEDAQDAATLFVNELADNSMAIAGFADDETVDCADCPGGTSHLGFEVLEDWGIDVPAMEAAISGTCPTGYTPLWESVCCAIEKAIETQPSNVLIVTDTGENNSDESLLAWPPLGDCSDCVTGPDAVAAATAAGTDVTFYVMDMTDYGGLGAPGEKHDAPGLTAKDDSQTLQQIAKQSGGLYYAVGNAAQLDSARAAIARHILMVGKSKQRPVTCNPGPFPIDVVQRYAVASGLPISPYNGQSITVRGVITAPRGTWDGATHYLEDCSGGVQFSTTSGPTALLGDSVAVTGTVSSILGEIRISPVTQLSIIGPGKLPSTAIQDPGIGHGLEAIGTLGTFEGFAAGPVVSFRFPLVSRLGGGPGVDSLLVLIDPDTGIPTTTIQPGSFYRITGVLGRRSGTTELRPRSMADFGVPVAVEPGPRTPGNAIEEISPNPFSGLTRITYALARPAHVTLRVFDVQGRLVRTLEDGVRPAGRAQVSWDGSADGGASSPNGLYFVRLSSPEIGVVTRRVLRVK